MSVTYLFRGGKCFRNGCLPFLAAVFTVLTAVLLLAGPPLEARNTSRNSELINEYKDNTLVLLEKEKELSRRFGSPRYYKARSDALEAKPVLGESVPFWTRNMSDWSDEQVNASLKWIGSRSYTYVATGINLSQDMLADLSSEFDTAIYPEIHRLFGSEPSPGIDGDPRITLLLIDQGDYVAGYFDPRNQYDVDKSNKREMIVLNIHRLLSDANDAEYELKRLKSTIAHEFQHLVHFAADPDEESWINEGLSQYAEYMIYRNTDKLSYFEANPSTSLTEWDWTLESYGAAFAFILYLGEHYSGDGSLKALVDEPANGTRGVEDFLAKSEAGSDFQTVFNDWTIANYLDAPDLAHGQYGYKGVDMRIRTDIVSVYPERGGLFLPPWSARYMTLAGNRQRSLRMDFQLAADSRLPSATSIYGSSGSTSVVVDQAIRKEEEAWSAFLPPTYMPLTLIMRSNDVAANLYPYTIRTSDEESDGKWYEGGSTIVADGSKSGYDWPKFGAVFIFALGLITTAITKGASSA